MLDSLNLDDNVMLKSLLHRCNTHRLLEQYIQKNEAAIASHRDQNQLYIKYQTFAEQVQEYPQELKQLELRKEELERQSADLIVELKATQHTCSQQAEQIRSLKDLTLLLEGDLSQAYKDILRLTMAAESQAKDLQEVHASRDQLAKELEKVSVERNYLQDLMLAEKSKISEQLNELNELNEQMQRQRRTLEQDQQRFNQQYKDMQSSGKFVTLAPQASDAQFNARNAVLDDIPQMIVRRMHKFHQVEIYDIAQNLNGSLIATCGGDRAIRLYDPLNLSQVSQMNNTGDDVYTTVEFSPQFDSILVSSTDNASLLYQLQGWKMKTRLAGHVDQVTQSKFLGGERDTCVTASKDRQIKVWNLQNGYCTKTIQTGSQVSALVSQHNVPMVISGHKDGSLRGYSLRTDTKPIFHEKNIFDDTVTSLAISSDNNTILGCSKEGYYIKAYELRMNKVIRTYENDKYMNSYDHNRICFGPDEKFIIAGNSDGSLMSWNSEGKFHKQLTKGQHEGVVLCVSYHPVSGQMYSADTRGNLVIWK